jgi:membrane protein DedA with SNARE-associated domain
VIPVEHQLFSGAAYLILFAGTVLEGETVLVSAGFAAQQGYLSLPMVVLAAWLGAISGDHLFFLLGRYRGRSIFEARSHVPGRLEKVRALLERYRSAVIVSFRFVYGFRMVAPFAIGAAGAPLGRFAALDAISGLAWATLFGLAGYFFGATLDVAVRDAHTRLAAGAGILGLIALAVAIAMMRKRSKDKATTVVV